MNAIAIARIAARRPICAVTDYQEFANRSHSILGQEGWQEVADAALDWAMSKARVMESAKSP